MRSNQIEDIAEAIDDATQAATSSLPKQSESISNGTKPSSPTGQVQRNRNTKAVGRTTLESTTNQIKPPETFPQPLAPALLMPKSLSHNNLVSGAIIVGMHFSSLLHAATAWCPVQSNIKCQLQLQQRRSSTYHDGSGYFVCTLQCFLNCSIISLGCRLQNYQNMVRYSNDSISKTIDAMPFNLKRYRERILI